MQKALLGHADPAQQFVEALLGEFTVWALEVGIIGDAVNERLVGDREAKVLGMRLDCGAADHLPENAPIEADGPRLVGRDTLFRIA